MVNSVQETFDDTKLVVDDLCERAYIPYVCLVEFLQISIHVNRTHGFGMQCAI